MLLLYATMIAATAFGGLSLPRPHSAPPLTYVQSNDEDENFICATLCPGTFCPGSCTSRGQEPTPADTRTLQSTGNTDGPTTYDAMRSQKRKKNDVEK